MIILNSDLNNAVRRGVEKLSNRPLVYHEGKYSRDQKNNYLSHFICLIIIKSTKLVPILQVRRTLEIIMRQLKDFYSKYAPYFIDFWQYLIIIIIFILALLFFV